MFPIWWPEDPHEAVVFVSVLRFRDVLMEAGIVTTTRKVRGDDIAAACGQLAGRVQDKTKRTQRLMEVRT